MPTACRLSQTLALMCRTRRFRRYAVQNEANCFAVPWLSPDAMQGCRASSEQVRAVAIPVWSVSVQARIARLVRAYLRKPFRPLPCEGNEPQALVQAKESHWVSGRGYLGLSVLRRPAHGRFGSDGLKCVALHRRRFPEGAKLQDHCRSSALGAAVEVLHAAAMKERPSRAEQGVVPEPGPVRLPPRANPSVKRTCLRHAAYLKR
jgi:hypothetical protein